MICKNCGKKVPNGVDTCPECNGNLSPNVPQAGGKSVIMKEETDHAIIWYLKKRAVYTAVAALVILVVSLNLIMAAVSFFNRIDFTEYVLVEVTGYDGRGWLDVQIDSEGLSGKLFGKASGELDSVERAELSTVVNLLQSGMEIDGTAFGYSNGDRVVLRIGNLDMLKGVVEQTCKNNDTITYTVRDLEEASVLAIDDLFDVSFTGFNGGGYVLFTPKAADIPWDITYSYDEFHIEGCTYNVYFQEGVAGALCNGDTVTIGLFPEWEDNPDYLLNTYGMCVSEEAVSYTVSGLSDPQSIDVLSLVEITFNGVEGSAEVGYRWNQETYQQGDVLLVPRDSQSSSFSITVSGAPLSGSGVVFASNDESVSITDQDLGWFYLDVDKSENISVGDTVTVAIRADRFDSLDDGLLASHGVEFTELDKAITVDAAMIPRLITSLDQVNAKNMSPLALSLTDSVKNELEKNWSYIVHGNRNYTCYDQVVTAGPEALEAHLVCTDAGSNFYSIWIVYTVQVTDSELDGAQMIYTTVCLDRPVVFQGDNGAVDYSGSMRIDFGRDPEFIYDSWWYRQENSTTIIF